MPALQDAKVPHKLTRDHIPRVGVRVVGARMGKPRSAQKRFLKRGEEVTLSYGTAYTRRVTRQHQSP